MNTQRKQTEPVRQWKRYNDTVLASLTEDFDCIMYVELTPERQNDIAEIFRMSPAAMELLPGIEAGSAFTRLLDRLEAECVVPEDREAFHRATRRPCILENLAGGAGVYYTTFRARQDGGLKYYRLKFNADRRDGELAGYVVSFYNVDPEISRSLRDRQALDIIGVLASEYNAVYYCDEDTHDYNILFQQGFVREQLDRMHELCPKYEDAFRYFVSMLVHPEDREAMTAEISAMPRRLRYQKSVRVEFRRLYGEEYLYTEMYCVKIGEADDELHAFVAGFAENDQSYRAAKGRRDQLEYLVEERTAELQKRNKVLNRVNEDIVELFGNLTEARDVSSGEHIRRVKGFTHILAEQVMRDWPGYGLTAEQVELMTSASALHDVGKISIPDAVLLKPGRLTAEEFEIMKTHCEKGCEILARAPRDWSEGYLHLSMDICRYHHERVDGRGYPEGLKGDAIPVPAQIVGVADCFDALISRRVYKDAIGMESAFHMILNGECGLFSDKIMASFRACRAKLFRHAADTSSHIRSAMPAGLGTAGLSWLRVLFVDDNDTNRELGEEILSEEGAEVTTAANGREALALFEQSPVGYYDVIMMDVVMPEMDGLEATRALRALPREDAKGVCVIALTSLAGVNDVSRCLAAGMDSFITKPVSVAALHKVLLESLRSSPAALEAAVNQTDSDAGERIDRALQRESFLTGLTADYDFICYINGNTNDVAGFRGSDFFMDRLAKVNPRLPPNRRLDQLLRSLIAPEKLPNFLEDTERARIVTYLKTNRTYQAVVPLLAEGGERLFRLRFTADEDAGGGYLLFLQSLDAEMQAEIRSRQLIRILSGAYIVMDYIDLKEDRFRRYQVNGALVREGVREGSFREESETYLESCVCEADRDRVREFLNPEHIRRRLLNANKAVIRYLSQSTGEPRSMEMQLVAAEETGGACLLLTVMDVHDTLPPERG